MNLRPAGVAALALVLVAAVAGGWWFVQTRRPDPATLRLVFPPEGATVSRVAATLEWRSNYAPLDLELYGDFEGILTLRTRSLDGNRAKLRAILDLSNFVVNDHPITKPPSTRARIELRTDGTNIGGGTLFFPGLRQAFLPAATGLAPDLAGHPVVPGDTWTDTLRVRVGGDLLHGDTYSELLRYEDVGGVRVAVVHGTKDLTIQGGRPLPGTGSMKIDQTAWLDPESGTLVRMTATVEVTYHSRPQPEFGGRPILIEGVDRYELNAV